MEAELAEIKRRRAALGMRQGELARLAGVSQSLIAKIESGKADPAFSKVKRIFEVLEGKQSEGEACAGELMREGVISVKPKTGVMEAVRIMKEKGISQMPVVEKEHVVGSLCEEGVLEGMQKFGREKLGGMNVEKIMDEPFLSVRENTSRRAIAEMLKKEKAVLIMKEGRMVGIITKVDLL